MKKFISLLLLSCLAVSVFGQEKKFKPSIKPDMRLIFKYVVDPDSETHLFDMERMYLGLKVKPVKNVTFRSTLDVKFNTNVQYKTAYFKYAYAEIKNIIPKAKIIFGQQKTGLIDYNGKFWGHRDLSKVGVDKNGMDTSADMGLAIDGKLPSKFGSYHVGLYAGEGYKKDTEEEDKAKAFNLRIDITPFAKKNKQLEKLMLTAYYKRWTAPSVGDSKDLVAGILSFRNKLFNSGLEFAYLNDSSKEIMMSAYTTLHLLNKKLDILARFDRYDSDKDADDDETYSIIAGVKYFVTKKTSVSLVSETTIQKMGTGVSDEKNTVFSLVFDQKF